MKHVAETFFLSHTDIADILYEISYKTWSTEYSTRNNCASCYEKRCWNIEWHVHKEGNDVIGKRGIYTVALPWAQPSVLGAFATLVYCVMNTPSAQVSPHCCLTNTWIFLFSHIQHIIMVRNTLCRSISISSSDHLISWG